jgi:hypothetical protein
MKKPKGHFLVFLLPLLHLCTCIIIVLAQLGKGWEYLGLIDFPASVLIVAIDYNFDHPLILFGVFGTLWWYFLSRGAEIMGARLLTIVQKRRDRVS